MGFSFEDAMADPGKTRCRLGTESDVLAAAVAIGALRIPDGTAEHLMRDMGRKQDPLGDAFAICGRPRSAGNRAQRILLLRLSKPW
jgi:hypothetical protein